MIEILMSLLLNLTGDRAIKLLLQMDWERAEEIIRQVNKTRGCPETYPGICKLKAILWGYTHNTRSPTGIARIISDSYIARHWCGLSSPPSHDCINDYIRALEPVISDIWLLLRDMAICKGIIKGYSQAPDPTGVETKYKKDKDGNWWYDEIKKVYKFGYGCNAIFDTVTQMPIAVMNTPSKKTDYEEIKKLYAMTPITPLLLTGDGEMDMIEFHNQLMNQGVIPVIRYNPRNTKVPLPMKYRIQQWFPRISKRWLEDAFDERADAEHGWSTLKERFGLEDLHLLGRNGFRVHMYLCMIHRYLDAFAVHSNCHGTSVRRSFMCL